MSKFSYVIFLSGDSDGDDAEIIDHESGLSAKAATNKAKRIVRELSDSPPHRTFDYVYLANSGMVAWCADRPNPADPEKPQKVGYVVFGG